MCGVAPPEPFTKYLHLSRKDEKAIGSYPTNRSNATWGQICPQFFNPTNSHISYSSTPTEFILLSVEGFKILFIFYLITNVVFRIMIAS
jgi:hypothetical protein